ncbi:5444_t:CDS:10 [Funneliformis mosseae]|uniref:5444_t:CDS:1 n=1 Tax=Funneliformis mosseae TaxID=27381 RepID=A0A9N9CKN2_FUNMO|nr:5444_t:CDS:10 [Funneliformis mosseae]
MEQANVESEIRGRHFQLPFEFNDKDRLGPWEILLSESTINDLREILYNEDFKDMQLELPLTIEMVMKKLRQLSSGAWKKYGLQHEASSYDVPVYKVEFPDNNLKILWQVDYGFSIHKYLYMQHVKVWTITSSQEKFDTTLKALKRVHKIYTSEYIRRCSILRMSKDHVVLPDYFKDKGTRFTNNELDNDRLLEVHKMFVTNKFIPISKDLFRSLIQSGSDFAFLVSKTEYEIISDPTSAIVYGRSGTGKTTCIVFRQLVSYLKSQLYKTPSSRGNDEYLYKRQIFITLNPILCLRVKKYFSQLQKSAELGGEKLTKARFLKWKKDNDSNKELDDDNMHEEDDEKKILGEIPNSFRLLTDHHFPLFVTFNKFSEMLQGTYGIDTRMLTTKQVQRHDADNDNAYDEGEFRFRTPFASMSNASWAHFVDYNLFEKKYWPHFSDYYRKKLDCELVYSEFSIIKGTNIEVDYLSREEYRSMSTRKHPAFCHNRDEVYDLFERYEMMKSRNYDFDSVDRTLAILRATKTRTFGGPHIHEVYIDECQDNQIIDYELILKLFDRADSIFMAGDVAQCIARGSTFRFRDLYALIYQWNLKRDLTENIHYNPIKPKEFELNTNYRSHRGILELASSVIHLLWKFFPDSIDKFSPELSEVGGPQPLIIEDCQAGNLFAYRNDVENEDANIEFGASQVIIVRNETAKQRVKDINSNIGLVLTVFEAKGMEFNDVLLYNFFTDSTALLKWRVILSDLDDHSEGNREFSPEKHYILSSELKHLYVAITRAREHLWIFDEDAKLSESIRTYWEHKKLVKITNEIDIFTLTKKSSPSEWNFEGKAFFEQQKYEQAIFCFKRSRNEKAENLARAYHLQQIARTSFVSGFDEKTVRSNFKSAAEAFEECSRLPQAASCYENIGMYRKAGDFYSESQMFEPAARCYLEVKMWNVAGGYFEKAKLYDDAALAYKDGNLNDMITDLIRRHRQDINVETINQLNLHFRQEAGNLQSHNKLEEAADMLNRSVDDNDIVDGSKHLLRLCRDIVLKALIIGFASSSMQELRRLHSKASKTISKVKTHERYNSLDDESQSYISYFNKDLDIYDMVTELIKRQDINGETIRQLNIHFRQEADNLLSQNKFEEAADMLIRSVDIDENTINASQYLLCLCRAIVLKETITGFTSSSYLQELRRLQSKAAKAISKVKIQTKRSKSLMEESQLYISYINKDLNKIYECGQFFMKNEELVTEFFAVIMWLQFPSPSDINIKYWDERLQCLLRLCKLAFPYLAPQKKDKIAKISKVFEDIFFCFESKINNPRRRKISFYNPLYYLMDIKHKNNEANTNSWKVYDLDVVHQKISQFLISYIYDLISKVSQDGRDNLDIASIVCYDFASSGNCHSSNCQMHHVTPTPLLLFQRLKLAKLQYTVVRQLDVLYRQGLLKEKSREFLASQNW